MHANEATSSTSFELCRQLFGYPFDLNRVRAVRQHVWRCGALRRTVLSMFDDSLQDESSMMVMTMQPQQIEHFVRLAFALLEVQDLALGHVQTICVWLYRHIKNQCILKDGYDSKFFQRVLSNLHKVLDHLTLIYRSLPAGCSPYENPCYYYTLSVMGLLKIGMIEGILEESSFYSHSISSAIKLSLDYVRLKSRKSPISLHNWAFLDFAFVLDLERKAELLRLDSALSMRRELQDAFFRAIFDGLQEPFLRIKVRRTHIIQDAVSQLDGLPSFELRKQLKVRFLGEEGEDQGGLRKEFFHLIIREIFNPSYGMFQMIEESEQFWFCPGRMMEREQQEDEEYLHEYYLVGLLIGLAIYNSVLIEVAFPRAVFRKLLGLPLTMQDFEQIYPHLTRSLKHMVECEDEEIFLEAYGHLTFCMDVPCARGCHSIELFPGGANIPVHHKDRHSYVDMYVNALLNLLPAAPFQSFRQGIMSVCGDSFLHCLSASETEQLICGTPNLRMTEWRETTTYEGGYTPLCPLIQWFWQVVMEEFSEEQRGRLLFFITGSRRAPLGGLRKLPLTIHRGGPDSDRLPTAHTCFNILMLPEYCSKDKLMRRLSTAISNCEGFGLI